MHAQPGHASGLKGDVGVGGVGGYTGGCGCGCATGCGGAATAALSHGSAASASQPYRHSRSSQWLLIDEADCMCFTVAGHQQ